MKNKHKTLNNVLPTDIYSWMIKMVEPIKKKKKNETLYLTTGISDV